MPSPQYQPFRHLPMCTPNLAHGMAQVARIGVVDGDGLDLVALPGYAIVNLFGRYNFTRNLYLGVRADNMFDQDYQTAAGFKSPGFLVLVTLNYVPAP